MVASIKPICVPQSKRVPRNRYASTSSAEIASISCISPPAPAWVASSKAKIRGLGTLGRAHRARQRPSLPDHPHAGEQLAQFAVLFKQVGQRQHAEPYVGKPFAELIKALNFTLLGLVWSRTSAPR